MQIKRRIDEKNKLLRTMASSGGSSGSSSKEAAYAIVDVSEASAASCTVIQKFPVSGSIGTCLLISTLISISIARVSNLLA